MWGGVICTAGQVAWNDRGELVGIGDVRAQTRQTLKNVEAVLAEAGARLSDVLKCTVYLADMAQFQLMNEEFAKAFPSDPPARTTVQARLAEPEMLVEIEAIACVASAAVSTRSADSRD
jgi:2-iminobutanoate/2-iminopropanoate deaminase